jgi:HSP20 family molecular chaperone IbpA
MVKKKKFSFLERLTGGVHADEIEDEYEEEEEDWKDTKHKVPVNSSNESLDTESDGQLTVDVINAPNEIIVKTMIAGVKPQDLEIELSRDVITIKGYREEESELEDGDYYHKELYWGSFSRTITLPEEVDVELAEAKEKHGLLTIRLPKVDKERRTKLQVKSS